MTKNDIERAFRVRHYDTLEFVVQNGRKGAGPLDEILSFAEKKFPLETWDEETTLLKQNLFLDGGNYQQAPLFDLPPVGPQQFSENFLVSPSGSLA